MSLLVSYALCSIAEARLAMDPGAEADELIAVFINGFSQAAQGYCGRLFEKTERTRYFDTNPPESPGGYTSSFQIDDPPIDVDAELNLYDDPSQVFDNTTLLVEGTDFVVDRPSGIIRRSAVAVSRDGVLLQTRRSGACFRGGPQSLKLVCTSGLIVPRGTSPETPTASTSDTGLTGTYRWVITTVIDGIESVASLASDPLVLMDQGAEVAFANPGVDATTRIYRNQNGGQAAYYVGSEAGDSGGAQTFTDQIPDDGLDLSRTPPGEGPVEVPPDLKLAALMQVTTWYRHKDEFGVQQAGMRGEWGSAVYFDPTKFLPFVQVTLDRYVAN